MWLYYTLCLQGTSLLYIFLLLLADIIKTYKQIGYKMKKQVLFMTLFCSSTAALSQDWKSLTVKASDNTELTFSYQIDELVVPGYSRTLTASPFLGKLPSPCSRPMPRSGRYHRSSRQQLLWVTGTFKQEHKWDHSWKLQYRWRWILFGIGWNRGHRRFKSKKKPRNQHKDRNSSRSRRQLVDGLN